MKTFFTYFILFLIYSFVGWAIEVVVTFNKDKKFVNRGFLLGPYCPIYGFSSIIMILYLSRYRNSFITVFLLAVVVCSIMEYLVSYLMEKLFKAKWWGKGYATEAFKRVIKFLFEEVEVETIYAEHLEANPASGRVMEKCGLTYEGTLRGIILDKISKKNEDIKSYSITREEYFK